METAVAPAWVVRPERRRPGTMARLRPLVEAAAALLMVDRGDQVDQVGRLKQAGLVATAQAARGTRVAEAVGALQDSTQRVLLAATAAEPRAAQVARAATRTVAQVAQPGVARAVLEQVGVRLDLVAAAAADHRADQVDSAGIMAAVVEAADLPPELGETAGRVKAA